MTKTGTTIRSMQKKYPDCSSPILYEYVSFDTFCRLHLYIHVHVYFLDDQGNA